MASCAPIIPPTAWPSSGANHGPIQSFASEKTPSSETNRPDTIFLMTLIPFGCGQRLPAGR